MMNYWLISDTHFGHDMLKTVGRPEGFEDVIMQNLKSFKPDDVVIHLGDFCFGNDVRWHEEWLKHTSSCRRWLVLGNHDHKSYSWYLAHGWHFVGASFALEIYGSRIAFSHVPREDNGTFNLNIHGHMHDNDHRAELGSILTAKHHLISLERTKYRPITLQSIVNSHKKESHESLR